MSIQDLKPAGLWHYFYQLTQIPRPSHQETAVQDFVLAEAARLGLWAERDAAGNVLVRKAASAGKEQVKGVILQSHLDMVAQKNQDSSHDFSRDPIQAYIDGEWVKARGTTLGADNGIGAAAALAILADNSLSHGPIEALFTATEETGMDGAKGLQGGWLQGDYLLNLDSEELGEICIGCAGGVDGSFSLPLAFAPNTQAGFQLQVRGLKGGHSGIDIHKQRGNAIKILLRLLRKLSDNIQIAEVGGGSLRNAIAREAQAIFASALSQAQLQAQIDELIPAIKRALAADEQTLRIELSPVAQPAQVWTAATQENLLRTLYLCPNGVDRMSMAVAGLVETSTNLAKISCEHEQLQVHCLLRSLDDAARDDLAERMADLFRLAGGSAVLSGAYPGWQPAPSSTISDVLSREGEKLLGKTPLITVIHAGLECGLLAQYYPHWQMASFGPTIEMPHSPDERVHIESVAQFWQWLVNTLAAVE